MHDQLNLEGTSSALAENHGDMGHLKEGGLSGSILVTTSECI